MKLIYDCDDNFEFEVEESINESGKTEKKYYIRGAFATIGKTNRNGRTYPRKIWEQVVDEYQNEIINGSPNSLMEYEHPARQTVNMLLSVARITKLYIEGDFVMGEAVLLNNEDANKLKDLIDNGIKMSVSSRGVGDVINGIVAKFKLITFDVVSFPSDYNATMNGIVENFNLKNGIVEELNFSLNESGAIICDEQISEEVKNEEVKISEENIIIPDIKIDQEELIREIRNMVDINCRSFLNGFIEWELSDLVERKLRSILPEGLKAYMDTFKRADYCEISEDKGSDAKHLGEGKESNVGDVNKDVVADGISDKEITSETNSPEEKTEQIDEITTSSDVATVQTKAGEIQKRVVGKSHSITDLKKLIKKTGIKQ